MDFTLNQRYSKELLLSLFHSMLRMRLAEESLIEAIKKGEIKTPAHLYSGEEAIAAGICAHLTKEDYIFGNHRSHGHYLAKGGDMGAMIAEIYCKETGCSKGRGGLDAPDRSRKWNHGHRPHRGWDHVIGIGSSPGIKHPKG